MTKFEPPFKQTLAFAFFSLLTGTAAAVDGITIDLGSSLVSSDADITPDGRYIVFTCADSLLPIDDDINQDVYLYDTETQTVELVSLSDSETNSSVFANQPSISNDGRYVCFRTAATDLGPTDSNGKLDVYLRDREMETTTLISVSSSEVQANDHCNNPTISGNGLFVAFESEATNLVGSDGNGFQDIFVRDISGGTTDRVTISTGSAEANGSCQNPAISFDGQYVAFDSEATTLVVGDGNMKFDVFLRDRMGNTTELVSIDSDEMQASNDSANPSISDDGSAIAFESSDNLLGEDDDNNVSPDIFVRDRSMGTTLRVSVSSSGVEGDGGSSDASISANGRYVAFESASTTLAAGFTDASVTDVYLHDRSTGKTRAISRTPGGGQTLDMGAESRKASAADNGTVAFESSASDLVADDANGAIDIFLNRDVSIEAAAARAEAAAASAARAALKAVLLKKSKRFKAKIRKLKKKGKTAKVRSLNKKLRKLKKQIQQL